MSVVIAVSPSLPCSSLIFGTDGWSYGDRTAHLNVRLNGMLGADRIPALTSLTPAPGDAGRFRNCCSCAQRCQLPAAPLGTSSALLSENQVRRFKHIVGEFATNKFSMHVPFQS